MKKRDKQPDPWLSEVELWPEAYREWAVHAAATMVLFGAEEGAVSPRLAEVRESVLASGQTPTALFGKPEVFGRTVGKRMRLPADVLEKDLPFRSIIGGVQVMLLAFGVMLIVLGLWIGIDDGWNTRSAQGQLVVLFPLTAVFCGLGIWGWILRTRGKLHLATASWAGAITGIVGTVGLVSSLPENLIPAPPNWSIPLAGVVLFAAALLIRATAQPPLVDDSNWGDSHWFSHAENLLRGRYLFSRAQASEALREAKDHREHTGHAATLAAEFGNVEVFAAQLAAINPPAIRRGVIAKRVGILFVMLYFAVFFVFAQLLEDGLTWRSGLNIAVLIVAAVVVAKSWRPNQINADAKKLRQRRMAQARALGYEDDC
ncbi:hypothetical protein ACFY5D_02540 [Paeniglutamicibacter sp. NPDC012692]|uniref:hypothetical protein n=1 Tax=Paeniglutamicibacter sp. NPDC012692 TaxID=3364388 RepID=UPI0036A3D2E6